jgi:hypothetical protein
MRVITISIEKSQFRRGISLVDTCIAIIIVAVVVVGAANFKFFAMRDSVRAQRQITSARTAMFFCQAWKGAGGDETFDPVSSLSPFISITAGAYSNEPNDCNLVGSYYVNTDNIAQNVTLAYRDINSDLKELNVIVAWNKLGEDPNNISEPDGFFELSTYCPK